MSVKINPLDQFKCFICGRANGLEDGDFETITVYEVAPLKGTITFTICQQCRKLALEKAVSSEFRKRYQMVGIEWDPVKTEESE